MPSADNSPGMHIQARVLLMIKPLILQTIS
jgi:hypothetical protein